jgi:hypothetical protein
MIESKGCYSYPEVSRALTETIRWLHCAGSTTERQGCSNAAQSSAHSSSSGTKRSEGQSVCLDCVHRCLTWVVLPDGSVEPTNGRIGGSRGSNPRE